MQRVVVTGSSGFLGRSIIRAIRERFPDAVILGIDVNEPAADAPHEFVESDIRDQALVERIAEFAPDVVLHFAFVVNPIHDDYLMHRINVLGTRNIFNAVRRCQPARFLVSSSATAYGAWPDNPVPMAETAPMRARTEFRYAEDKTRLETELDLFAKENPQIACSWTRPTVIFQPGASNYISRLLLTAPLLVKPGGFDTPMQFVHMEDVVAAHLAILDAHARGPFNVGPDDWIPLSEIAKMRRRMILPAPFSLCRAITALWWGLRLPIYDFPSGFWFFLRYPWVITPERLTNELGFEFRYSSRDTLQMLMDGQRCP